MDPQRARDITGLPVMAHVLYNGVPVYIDSISSDNSTAFIHPLDKPTQRQKVSISSLQEI